MTDNAKQSERTKQAVAEWETTLELIMFKAAMYDTLRNMILTDVFKVEGRLAHTVRASVEIVDGIIADKKARMGMKEGKE